MRFIYRLLNLIPFINRSKLRSVNIDCVGDGFDALVHENHADELKRRLVGFFTLLKVSNHNVELYRFSNDSSYERVDDPPRIISHNRHLIYLRCYVYRRDYDMIPYSFVFDLDPKDRRLRRILVSEVSMNHPDRNEPLVLYHEFKYPREVRGFFNFLNRVTLDGMEEKSRFPNG